MLDVEHAMTLDEQRANLRASWDLAIAEIRREAIEECRGEPLKPAEIAAALQRVGR